MNPALSLRELFRFLFPTQCVSCGNVLVGSELQLCAKCLKALPTTNYAVIAGNEAECRLRQLIPVEAAMALLHFRQGEVSQHIVHAVKYHGNSELGLMMGRQMGIALQHSDRFTDIDLMVPVPLHFTRRLQRGYNQSRLLCEGIAQVFRCPVESRAIRRVRRTETQTHKSHIERIANVEGAFRVVRPDLLEGRHVLIVDDVMTTGATIASCARPVLELPGTRVSVATLTVAGI
ncbi:MAG: ComF family protein [Bacteroidales bacterium]|nr:ComF family protein [Bacteroidales bacterium]